MIPRRKRAAGRPRVGHRALNKSTFREGDRFPNAHDQVVDQANIHELERRFQSLRDQLIGVRWLGAITWVVMRTYNPGGIVT